MFMKYRKAAVTFKTDWQSTLLIGHEGDSSKGKAPGVPGKSHPAGLLVPTTHSLGIRLQVQTHLPWETLEDSSEMCLGQEKEVELTHLRVGAGR